MSWKILIYITKMYFEIIRGLSKIFKDSFSFSVCQDTFYMKNAEIANIDTLHIYFRSIFLLFQKMLECF